MFKKTLLGSLLVFGLSSLSFATLTIKNETKFDSTAVINKGMCSKWLSGGVTKAGTTNVIADWVLNLACRKDKENCHADVYMTNDCSGPIVGTAEFSLTKGVRDINVIDKAHFDVTKQGPFFIVLKQK